MKPLGYFCAALVFAGGTASANLIDEGALTLSGSGLGAVPTILTLQSTGNVSNEAGCVAWNGTTDVTGTCATAFGTFAGGEEKPGASQTQAQLVSDARDLSGFSGAISSYADLGLVMNIGQPAGGSIDLTSLTLTVYANGEAPQSVQLKCPAGGCVFPSSTPGMGTSDELFGISSDEIGDLGTFSSTARVGVAASFTGAHGAPESFFLAAIPAASATSSGIAAVGAGPAPEPAPTVLLALGLLSLLLAGRRRPQA